MWRSCSAGARSRSSPAPTTCAWSPDQIRQWIPGRYVTLGTDGFGRSDGRAALRSHFEVDRRFIVLAALKALADEGSIDRGVLTQAVTKLGIDPAKANPLNS